MNLLVSGILAALVMLPAPAPLLDPSPSAPADRPRPVAVWPLEDTEVVAGFDLPASTWSAGHRGVDLLGSPGQAVRAALAGTVAFAGTVAGRGVVVVDHGTFRTTYEPVEVAVTEGARLAAGASVGTLQAGPSHCAPRVCLHWGLVEADTYRDPLSLLRSVRVRLLPLGRAGLEGRATPAGGPDGTPGGAARW